VRSRSVVPPALVASLALAACGGGSRGPAAPTAPATPSTPATPPTPTPPAATASISMRSDSDVYGSTSSTFAPARVTITRNGSVTWRNATGVAHNVTFDRGSGAPADVADHASGTHTRTFATAGTYGFRCTNHEGMVGTVDVAP
jgi:plastocyanin